MSAAQADWDDKMRGKVPTNYDMDIAERVKRAARLDMLATHIDKAKALDMITKARQDERRKVSEKHETYVRKLLDGAKNGLSPASAGYRTACRDCLKGIRVLAEEVT